MCRSTNVVGCVLAFGAATAGASPALAYVDPGAAGFVIVSLLGFLTAAGYTIRLHFAKLKAWVRKVLGKRNAAGAGAAGGERNAAGAGGKTTAQGETPDGRKASTEG